MLAELQRNPKRTGFRPGQLPYPTTYAWSCATPGEYDAFGFDPDWAAGKPPAGTNGRLRGPMTRPSMAGLEGGRLNGHAHLVQGV
jgi:hypothetical protein